MNFYMSKLVCNHHLDQDVKTADVSLEPLQAISPEVTTMLTSITIEEFCVFFNCIQMES